MSHLCCTVLGCSALWPMASWLALLAHAGRFLQACGIAGDALCVAYKSSSVEDFIEAHFEERPLGAPLVLGFKAETSSKGPDDIVLLQLASDKAVLLAHLEAMGRVPPCLQALLGDPDVCLVALPEPPRPGPDPHPTTGRPKGRVLLVFFDFKQNVLPLGRG